MKTKKHFVLPAFTKHTLLIMGILLGVARICPADPLLTSWLTNFTGQYARIYTNDAAKSAGNTVTTWTNGSLSQSLPAYSGVQEVESSSNWVYVTTTGLAIHNMGPWYLNAAHTTNFPNWPVNQKVLYRIPRTNSVPTTKSITGGGTIGCFVDGVAMFNSWDAYYWNGTTDTNGNGTGYWNRDAFVNEGVSFDAAYAHQQNTGTYHYHADPIALRYLAADHVNYNTSTKTYSESTNTPTKHSPILGWVADGFPVYGPYGYSVATNPASGIRRMVSGYVIRNGQYGTSNLTGNGRTTIPAWAARLYNVSSNQTGPNVSAAYPLGRYMEDNDYLGDRGYVQGVDFDLDQYNCRWCVTPEFPGGTYAYFVAIDSNGIPIFPYNIGRGYFGNPTGGSVTSITETVATNFVGGANSTLKLGAPGWTNNTVTLAWSAVEGGMYQVESTPDFSGWSTNATNISAVQRSGSYSGASAQGRRFFRVALTGLASYDPATSSGVGILSISPTNGSPGTTFTLTINLDPTQMLPPQTAPINSVMVGSITGMTNTHVSQTEVTSSITIPSGASPGPQTVQVVFPGPPGDATNTVTYSLIGGFNIN
jgi:YHYH protein